MEFNVSRVTEILRTGITWDESRCLDVEAFHFAQLETFHVRTDLLNVQIIGCMYKGRIWGPKHLKSSHRYCIFMCGGYWEYPDFKWCDRSKNSVPKSGSVLAVRNELENFSYKTSVVEIIFMIQKETVYWKLTQLHICRPKLPYKMEAQ